MSFFLLTTISDNSLSIKFLVIIPAKEKVWLPSISHFYSTPEQGIVEFQCCDICKISSYNFRTVKENRQVGYVGIIVYVKLSFTGRFSKLQNPAGQAYHLDSTDKLLLLHVNMGDIQPNITEIRSCLTDLSKYITSLINTPLVCQYTPNTVCSPNIFGICTKDLQYKYQLALECFKS